MIRIIKNAVITSVAAAAIGAIAIGPASATTITGGGTFAATSSNAKLVSGTVTFACPTSNLNGKIITFSGTPPFQAGVINGISWSGCTASGNPATVTASALPWALWITGSTNSSGVTPVEVRGFNVTISIPSLGCTASVTGTAPATFTNSTQDLKFTGGSMPTAVSGFCPGWGSTSSLTGDYIVSATDASGNPSPITIS